jgi:hypothetical protein
MEPEDSDVEKMVDEIYLRNDKEPKASLTIAEFQDWVFDELNLGEKKGQRRNITMPKVMVKFDVLDAEDEKEIEEARLLAIANSPVKPSKHKHRKSNAAHHERKKSSTGGEHKHHHHSDK